MKKDIEERLYRVAVNFLNKRFPIGWGGVGVAYTDKGKFLISVAPDVFNASVELCVETGVILEAFKLNEKITHMLGIVRDNENEEVKVLTPCGVCQERLSYFGRNLKCAVTNLENKLIFKTLEELMPYYWGNAYEDITF